MGFRSRTTRASSAEHRIHSRPGTSPKPGPVCMSGHGRSFIKPLACFAVAWLDGPMTQTMSTVKGIDLTELVGQDRAIKINSRWYWFVGYHEAHPAERYLSSGTGFAIVVPVRLDPRLAKTRPIERSSRRAIVILRCIHRDNDYQVRDQARPVWDWVSREIEREGL